MLRTLMLDLPDIPWVALDTETSGLFVDDGAFVACVALAHVYEDGRVWSVGLPFDQGERDKIPSVQLDMFESAEDPNLSIEAWRELLAWLRGREHVEHNGKYDTTMMRRGSRLLGYEGEDFIDQLVWDTMLAQRELDPTESAGLDAACSRLGIGGKQGLDGVKQWLKQHKYPPNRYDLVPWHIIREYVVTDAEQTARLYVHQLERYDRGEGDWDEMERQLGLLKALYRMEQRGIPYNMERSIAAAERLEHEAEGIEARMPFPANPAGAKRYFIGEQGLKADRVSDKTGEPSVDEEQIRKWTKQGVPWAREYGEATKRRRAVSMWYRGYPEKIGADGRLRTSFRQGHVKSGRMSVERVQLQAMPKKDKGFEGIPGIRELVVPDPGRGIWNLDLSQAELRVAAKYAKCKLMLELLGQGADMHGVTCEGVMKIPRDHPEWKEKRDIAKRLTFGGIFQIGAEKFQATLAKLADIHLPIEECEDLVNNWRRMYPEYGDMYYRAMKHAERHGWVPLLPKTDYEVASWFGPHDYPKSAWNRIVQGSLARFFGMWLAETEREWPGYAILTVHDSIMLEAPEDEGDEVSRLVAARGAAMATEMFQIEMKVDVDRWGTGFAPPDKATKGDSQYEGVK